MSGSSEWAGEGSPYPDQDIMLERGPDGGWREQGIETRQTGKGDEIPHRLHVWQPFAGLDQAAGAPGPDDIDPNRKWAPITEPETAAAIARDHDPAHFDAD